MKRILASFAAFLTPLATVWLSGFDLFQRSLPTSLTVLFGGLLGIWIYIAPWWEE